MPTAPRQDLGCRRCDGRRNRTRQARLGRRALL